MSRISTTFESDIDANSIAKEIEEDRTLGLVAANEWYRLYTPYVPRNTGDLWKNVDIEPWEIEHLMTYAEDAYTTDMNFRTDKHSLATKEWDQAADKAGKTKILVATLQRYIDSK